MLIDAHCHLEDEQFAGDLDEVIARAVDAGVVAMVIAGTDIPTSQAAIALADRYAPVYAAVGIHPHHAGTFSDTTRKAIHALAQHRKVVAIGEIGLDFHYPDGASRAVQERNFIAHLDLAEELGKPVVIHDRDAHDRVLAILCERNGKPRGMLHCFSGNLAMARRAVEMGHLISFAGNVTFSNAHELQAVASALSLDNILVETDSPYLSPHRGRRNEPANVTAVSAKLAELLHADADVVEQATLRNTAMLFGLRIVE